MHGRLIFGLCRTCCEELRQDDCNHEQVGEREFTGTWFVHCVTDIFIIWQYETTQFDASTSEGGLFTSYVNTFLRLKQQANDWPAECTDDESRKRYIGEYVTFRCEIMFEFVVGKIWIVLEYDTNDNYKNARTVTKTSYIAGKRSIRCSYG